MIQKSSLAENLRSVSIVLTSDTIGEQPGLVLRIVPLAPQGTGAHLGPTSSQ
jgi:hypothetical protein